jgi:hypothetical protein
VDFSFLKKDFLNFKRTIKLYVNQWIASKPLRCTLDCDANCKIFMELVCFNFGAFIDQV